MTEKYLVIDNGKNNIDFFLICHAACQKVGNFQWFLMNDPNDDKKTYLKHYIYESITISSQWITENAEGKWLGCRCHLDEDDYTEMLCFLSGNILKMLRNNKFQTIGICDIHGMIDNEYILGQLFGYGITEHAERHVKLSVVPERAR